MFRPARRVSWGTRIFALLVFLVAVGAIGAFLAVLLPQQVAKLAQMEGNELVLAPGPATISGTRINRSSTDSR